MRPFFLLPPVLLCVGASSADAAPPAQGDGPIYTGVWMAATDASDAQNQFSSGLDLNAFVQLPNANHAYPSPGTPTDLPEEPQTDADRVGL